MNTDTAKSDIIDPIDRIRALMDITQSLSAIFARENELLETRRPREIAPLQAEKARLAAAYAQSIRDVASNRAAVQHADSTLLAELRDITAGFEERAAHQRSLLEAAARAGEGVVKAIAEEAAAQSSAQSYGGENRAEAPPISINEKA